jgi:hypothetical protein
MIDGNSVSEHNQAAVWIARECRDPMDPMLYLGRTSHTKLLHLYPYRWRHRCRLKAGNAASPNSTFNGAIP